MPICEGPLLCQYTGVGAVAALERRLEQHFGMRYALAVSNATVGLLGVALALELRNQAFLTTPYTWGGSLAGWLLLGNRPLFADIHPVGLTLEPAAARHALRPGVRAVLTVDISGNPCDMDGLRCLADDHGLIWVDDAAQAFGARHKGRPAGSLADAMVVSFGSGKTLVAGEEGAVLTNHANLYDRLLWFTQHPVRQRRELGLHLANEFALNARIHPVAAEAVLRGFEAALSAVERRRRCARQYWQALARTPVLQHPLCPARDSEPSYYRVTAAWADDPRPDPLLRLLRAHRLPAAPRSNPVQLLYRLPAFRAQFGRQLAARPRCPVAESQVARRFEIIL